MCLQEWALSARRRGMAESREIDEVVVLKLSTGEQKQVAKEAQKVWRDVYGSFRTRTCPRIDIGSKRKAHSKYVRGSSFHLCYHNFRVDLRGL